MKKQICRNADRRSHQKAGSRNTRQGDLRGSWDQRADLLQLES